MHVRKQVRTVVLRLLGREPEQVEALERQQANMQKLDEVDRTLDKLLLELDKTNKVSEQRSVALKEAADSCPPAAVTDSVPDLQQQELSHDVPVFFRKPSPSRSG
jgi:hypothetical protein